MSFISKKKLDIKEFKVSKQIFKLSLVVALAIISVSYTTAEYVDEPYSWVDVYTLYDGGPALGVYNAEMKVSPPVATTYTSAEDTIQIRWDCDLNGGFSIVLKLSKGRF